MIIGLPTLFRAWLINAKNSAFVRIMMLLNPVIQIIYMLACITAQINQRSIIVAKSQKYFLHLEIFATCPKYIQFTAFPKNLFIRNEAGLTLCEKKMYKPANGSNIKFCFQFLLKFHHFDEMWFIWKVPAKHQHIMGFRDKMKRNAFF